MVKFTKANNLSKQEIVNAENKLFKAVQAKNGHYCSQKVGLDAEAHITGQTTRPECAFTPGMNVGDNVGHIL